MVALSLTGALMAASGLGTGLALATVIPATAPAAAASSDLTGTTADPPAWMAGHAGYANMMNRYRGPTATSRWPGGMANHRTGTGMMGGGYGAYSGTGMGAVIGFTRALATAGARCKTPQCSACARSTRS